MADWKKLAKAALLADGRIDVREAEILRLEIFANRQADEEELEFLAELRNHAQSCVPSFTALFFKAVKEYVLEDGEVDDAEALWLRDTLFADNRIDPDEVALLRDLKASAIRTGPEFDKLYLDCVK